MEAFALHTGLVVPLDRANVDTDQLAPKEFLKGTERTGYGRILFYNWRYLADGSPNPDFVLNRTGYESASVLVAGRNFGCGSSREHAVWALQDYGIRVVIAPSFADIFYNNCFKSGVLPIAMPDSVVAHVMRCAADGEYRITVDLQECRLTDGRSLNESFQIDGFRRDGLLQGLDEIGLTLRHEELIRAFEEQRIGNFS